MKGRTWGSAVAVALLCAVTGGVVSGCGSSNSLDPIAQAAEVSTGYSGYRMAFSMQFSSSALPGPISATGAGRFDRSARSGSLAFSMDLSAIPQVSQALGSSRLRLVELISGTDAYIRLPAVLTRRLPSGKPWLKINLAQVAANGGVPGLGSLINNPTSNDPSQLLQYLRATSGSVTKVGTSSVRGIPTTVYRATINLDRVPGALPAADRAKAQQAIAAIERVAHVHQIPVTVWIDSHNLVRRLQTSLTESLSNGQSGSVRITADILDYGPQAPPVLPPPSQVTDITGSVGSAGGKTAIP